ncbi:MAG TPA: hypothetical protein VL049_17315 [Candidatus Dormibacteraeota bacterium]|nr:hypothetical protein [Candidatus Dormibacteraeota bacterium]
MRPLQEKATRISRAQPSQRKRGETARHHAAGEKLAQLPLHEARQPLPAAALARLGEKGLEVLADDAVQDALLGLAAHVGVAPAAALSRVGARPAG